MKRQILIILGVAVIFLTAIAIAYAMSPTPWCYMDTTNSYCTNITTSTPLPVYTP